MDASLFSLLNGLLGRNAFLDQTIYFLAEHLAYVLVGFFMLYVFVVIKEGRERLIAIALGLGVPLIARNIAGIIKLWSDPRPFALDDVPHLLTLATNAFPSGHATTFFALSVITYRYHRWLGIWFFAASTIMGAARVAAGVHYPIDILGGAALGLAIGWIALSAHARTVRTA